MAFGKIASKLAGKVAKKKKTTNKGRKKIKPYVKPFQEQVAYYKTVLERANKNAASGNEKALKNDMQVLRAVQAQIKQDFGKKPMKPTPNLPKLKLKKPPVKKMKPGTKAAAGVVGGATGASALIEKKRFGGTVLKLTDVAKRLKDRPKTTTKKKPKSKPKPTPKRQVKGAKMIQGAGDKSDPKVGKFGAGQKQARGGATPAAKEAMSSTEKDRLARGKAARGSFERAKGLKKGSLAQLQDDYSKLKVGDKRAERLKGTKSKYYPVFKKRGMKPMKKGGPIGSTTKPKKRPVDGIKMAAEQPSWMKGLTQGEIDAILGRPTRDSGGVKRSEKKKKKKKKTVTARTGGQVISKKNGGKVNMGYGDSLVRKGYDNN